jgi:hypothetical protein
MELITKLSGLLKAITYTIRVSTSGRLKLSGLQKSIMVVLNPEISGETVTMVTF